MNTEQDDREQIEVLIETYWNVNETFFEKACKFFKVLIETYWNVNHCSSHCCPESDHRINRNILECK